MKILIELANELLRKDANHVCARFVCGKAYKADRQLIECGAFTFLEINHVCVHSGNFISPIIQSRLCASVCVCVCGSVLFTRQVNSHGIKQTKVGNSATCRLQFKQQVSEGKSKPLKNGSKSAAGNIAAPSRAVSDALRRDEIKKGGSQTANKT